MFNIKTYPELIKIHDNGPTIELAAWLPFWLRTIITEYLVNNFVSYRCRRQVMVLFELGTQKATGESVFFFQ